MPSVVVVQHTFDCAPDGRPAGLSVHMHAGRLVSELTERTAESEMGRILRIRGSS